jgi:5'-3' exonuclease
MGVRGFLSFIQPVKKKANVCQQEGLRVGIDAFCLIYLFREERKAFEDYLRGLLSKGYILTFVLDRRAQKEKKAVVEERKQRKEEAKQEANQLKLFMLTEEFEELGAEYKKTITDKVAQKEWEAWCLYAEYTEWLLSLLQSLKISVVKAKEEADTLLAQSDFDVVISSDSDMFVLGCERVWIPKGKFLQHDEYLLEDVEKHIGLFQETFCELAYLVGCDVQPKKKMAMEEAISHLRFYGSLMGIHMKDTNKVSADDLEEFVKLKKAIWS